MLGCILILELPYPNYNFEKAAAHNLENAVKYRAQRLRKGKRSGDLSVTDSGGSFALLSSHFQTPFLCSILTFFVQKRTQCFVQIVIWRQTANY